jgi:hypothetical protein
VEVIFIADLAGTVTEGYAEKDFVYLVVVP